MLGSIRLLIGVGVFASLVMGSAASAATIYGSAADFNGSRSVGDGLEVIAEQKPGNGPKGDWSGGTIEWTVTQEVGVGFIYKYTLTNFGDSPAVSHFTVDLTDEGLNDESIITDVTADAEAVPTDKIINWQ